LVDLLLEQLPLLEHAVISLGKRDEGGEVFHLVLVGDDSVQQPGPEGFFRLDTDRAYLGIPAFAAESDNSPVERVQEVYIRSQNGFLCEIHADKIIISHQLDYKPVIIIVSWLGTGVYQFSGYLVEYRERGSFRRIESTAVCEIGGRHGWAICGSIGFCHLTIPQIQKCGVLLLE